MESYQQRAGREAIMADPPGGPYGLECRTRRLAGEFTDKILGPDPVDPRDEKLRADIEEWWDKHRYEGAVGVDVYYELAKIIRGEGR
jgi:hypothetical protein